MNPSVYCIVVTFNGEHWIRKCLDSLDPEGGAYRVIVIDNGSSDNTISIVEQEYPAVMLIKAVRNRGFGQANNEGLKIALEEKVDYVFLLNQDAWVEADTISSLIGCHNADHSYGILSPMHHTGEDNGLDRLFERYLREALSPGDRVMSTSAHPELPGIIDSQFVNAAAWLITRECLEKTGGFDPAFFHYGEDRNYCQRVLSKGFHIGICTKTRIFHDRAARLRDLSPNFARQLNNYLVEFCDIRRKGYRIYMIKRTLRHLLMTPIHLLKGRKQEALKSLKTSWFIVNAFPLVRRSRQGTINANRPAHLG